MFRLFTLAASLMLALLVGSALGQSNMSVNDFDMFEKFDASEFTALTEDVFKCIRAWKFTCAKEKLEEAEYYISSSEDSEIIAHLRFYLDFEELLRNASTCVELKDFKCAEDWLSRAKELAKTLDAEIFVTHSYLEGRIEETKDYVASAKEKLKQERAAKKETTKSKSSGSYSGASIPVIKLVGVDNYSDRVTLRTLVEADGKPTLKIYVNIYKKPEKVSSLFSNTYAYDVTVHLIEGGSSFSSSIRSAIPRTLCTIYSTKYDYSYDNELRCVDAGTIATKHGYEPITFTTGELARYVVEYYLRKLGY